MPDATPIIRSIGTTHYRRYINGSRTYEIAVQQVSGTVAAHFASSMQVDADGAPKGYHDGDQREFQNNHDCYDWLENLSESDRHGQQGIGGAVGPAPGFTISGTSLCNPQIGTSNTARYVDASTIPFVVLPKDFPLPAGTTPPASRITDCLGCLCYVTNLETGNATGAVFADIGPRVGEASLATALRLGHRPFYPRFFPKVTGIDSKRFLTIVFPNERLAMPLAVDDIETRAKAQFQVWGDWTGLAAALKQVPKETPAGASDDDIATLPLPPPKGPVAQLPLVGASLQPGPRLLATNSDAGLLDAPNGNQIATVPAGADLDLVEALPHGDWLRVLVTIDGNISQGFVAADKTASR